eukprot:12921576-Prorocentrum_lima.AAC.1
MGSVKADSDLVHYVVADVDVGCQSWQLIEVAFHVVHSLMAAAKVDPVAGPRHRQLPTRGVASERAAGRKKGYGQASGRTSSG